MTLFGIITFACVCATNIKVNQDCSVLTSQIVREVPSTQTNPLGTIYFNDVGGTWTWKIQKIKKQKRKKLRN